MTERQRDLLRFIARFIVENDGIAPSLSEMAAAMGLAARSGAHRLVEGLIAQGRLRRNGRTRGYEVVGSAVDLSAVANADLLAEAGRRGLLQGVA